MGDGISVLVCHDRPYILVPLTVHLKQQGFSVIPCGTADTSLTTVRYGGGRFDCALIHKDLGGNDHDMPLGLLADHVAQAIIEEAPHIRTGFVSGEFPDGLEHVRRLRGNFYLHVLDITGDFLLNQLYRSALTPDEQELKLTGGYRGPEMPPPTGPEAYHPAFRK